MRVLDTNDVPLDPVEFAVGASIVVADVSGVREASEDSLPWVAVFVVGLVVAFRGAPVIVAGLVAVVDAAVGTTRCLVSTITSLAVEVPSGIVIAVDGRMVVRLTVVVVDSLIGAIVRIVADVCVAVVRIDVVADGDPAVVVGGLIVPFIIRANPLCSPSVSDLNAMRKTVPAKVGRTTEFS